MDDLNWRFMVPRFRWVVRDDDLKALDAGLDGLKAAATIGTVAVAFSFTQLVAGVVGVVTTAAKLMRQALKKGARIEPASMRLLCILAANRKGLTTAELTEVFARTEPTATEETVSSLLRTLSKTPLADGTTAALVSEDASGRWRASGV